MLWSIAINFGLLWALGMATSITLGGFIHLLLGVAFALVLVQIFKNRRRRTLGTPSGRRTRDASPAPEAGR